MNKEIRGFKAFDRDMKCRGFQYEIGKVYACDKAVICREGFHFCTSPQDLFMYYPPAGSRFAEVIGRGQTVDHDQDSKVACTEIEIVREISLCEMIELCIKHTWDAAEKVAGQEATGYQGAASATGNRGAASATGNRGAASATGYQGAASATGDQGAASATGDQGAASATGYRGAASATGYQGAASATGDDSVACALGWRCRAKGGESSWLVLAERDDDGAILAMAAVPVDGVNVRSGVWYTLLNGQVVALED